MKNPRQTISATSSIICHHLMPRWISKRFMTEETGQSLLVLVVSMTAIIALVALALDGGLVFAFHARMQTAADAAALSSARLLAMDISEQAAIAQANQILAANGADIGASTITITGGKTVNVTAVTPFDTYFAGMLGVNQVNVSASSAATFGSIVVTDSVLPLAVPEDWWSPGSAVTLYNSDAGVGPGNWGWVNWGSRGNAKDNVIPPLSDTQISIDQWIEAEPGANTSATQAVRDYWVGQTVTMFLYDTTNGETGRGMQYHVSGFAQFKITDVKATGNPKYIQGEFIDFVQLGGTIDPSGTFGNMGVALVGLSGGGGGSTPATSAPATATPGSVATATPVPATVTPGGVSTATPVPPTATVAAPSPVPTCELLPNGKCKKK